MDNFTNQDNNMQNTAGGNTYSYDYMNNAANIIPTIVSTS